MAPTLKKTIEDETYVILTICCFYFFSFLLNNMLTNPVNPGPGPGGAPPPLRNSSSTGFVLGTELRYRHGAGNVHAPEPYGDGQFPLANTNYTNNTRDKTLQGVFFILCIGLSIYHLAFSIIYFTIYDGMDTKDSKRKIVNSLSFVHLLFSIVFMISIAFFIFVLNKDTGDLTITNYTRAQIAYNPRSILHRRIKEKVKVTVNLSRFILVMNIATFVYFLVFILYFQPKLYPL
jgi:hypothetical protein